MMKKVILVALVCMAPYAQAQDAPVPASSEMTGEDQQKVVVSAARELPFVPYKTMLRGVAAFEKHRAHAPAATLRFSLHDKKGAGDLSSLRMQLLSDAGSVAIPVKADGSFELPLAGANAELVLNRPKTQLTVDPLVMSPGTTLLRRRLGDMRLECRIWFALEEDEMPFWFRNGLKLAGGPCTLKNFGYYRKMPPGAGSYILVDGERRTSRKPGLPAMTSFTLPYYDKSWPDDTLILFTPAEPVSTSAGTGERTRP